MSVIIDQLLVNNLIIFETQVEDKIKNKQKN